LSSAENYLIGCNVLEHLFQRGVAASRLANMTQTDGARKTHEILGRGDASANLQEHDNKRSQSEAAEMLNVTLSGAINYQLENRRYALAVNLHLAFGRSAVPCLA